MESDILIHIKKLKKWNGSEIDREDNLWTYKIFQISNDRTMKHWRHSSFYVAIGYFLKWSKSEDSAAYLEEGCAPGLVGTQRGLNSDKLSLDGGGRDSAFSGIESVA